jgi:hypothetical protein
MLNDFLSSKHDIGLFRPQLSARTSVRLLFHVLNPTAAALPYLLDGLTKAGFRLADFAQDD